MARYNLLCPIPIPKLQLAVSTDTDIHPIPSFFLHRVVGCCCSCNIVLGWTQARLGWAFRFRCRVYHFFFSMIESSLELDISVFLIKELFCCCVEDLVNPLCFCEIAAAVLCLFFVLCLLCSLSSRPLHYQPIKRLISPRASLTTAPFSLQGSSNQLLIGRRSVFLRHLVMNGQCASVV